MFNLYCGLLKKTICTRDFGKGSAFETLHLSADDKDLPDEIFNAYLTVCGQCFMCQHSLEAIKFSLKRIILSCFGYLVCKYKHGPIKGLCIRKAMLPLTSTQKQLSHFYFSKILTRTCPQKANEASLMDFVQDPLLCVKRLPSLEQSLQTFRKDLFHCNHLISDKHFINQYALTTSELNYLVRPIYFRLIRAHLLFEQQFLHELKNYFCLLLGLQFETHVKRRFLSHVTNMISEEQHQLFKEINIVNIMLPEYNLFL